MRPAKTSLVVVAHSPGYKASTTTGACRNIHQMKFTVAGIPTSEFRLLRT